MPGVARAAAAAASAAQQADAEKVAPDPGKVDSDKTREVAAREAEPIEEGRSEENKKGLSEDEAGIDLAYRARAARANALAAIEEVAGVEEAAAWRRVLLPAAKSVADVLMRLYDRLSRSVAEGVSDVFVDTGQLREVQLILNQDLDALLTFMGYTPPPGQQELVAQLLDAVEGYVAAATNPGALISERAGLAVAVGAFEIRLNELIEQAESDEALSAQQDRRLRVTLLAHLKTATVVLIPACIAAAGVAFVFPPAGTAIAQALLPRVAAAAGKEGLGKVLKGAAGWLLRRLLGPPHDAEAHILVERDTLQALLVDLVVVAKAENQEAATRLAAAYGVAVTDHLFQLASCCLRVNGADEAALELRCRNAIALLDRCRDADNRVDAAKVNSSADELLALQQALAPT
jgi:hypothetical protein